MIDFIVSTLQSFYYSHCKNITWKNGRHCIFRNVSIESKGKGNHIILGKNVKLKNVSFIILGNNNTIKLKDSCDFCSVTFTQEDDRNSIEIGNASFIGSGFVATMEGTSIKIGERTIIARRLEMRTSDSHSMLDSNGKRKNPAKDIVVGNHVWIGTDCMILKGCEIPDDYVVAAKSLVGKLHDVASHSLIAGTPAKVIRTDINWCIDR